MAVSAAQLPFDHGQRLVALRRPPAHPFRVPAERPHPHVTVRRERAKLLDHLGQVGLRRVMIRSSHHEPVRRPGAWLEHRAQPVPPLRERGSAGGDARPVLVARRGKVDHQHFAPISRAPSVQVALLPGLASEPAPQECYVDPEPTEDERQRTGVPERIRRVADPHRRSAEPPYRRSALDQVPHQRFRRYQQLVGQHIPRPCLEPALGEQAANRVAGLRAHREVVVEDDSLPIQQERGIIGAAAQQLDQVVHEPGEPQPETGRPVIPLAVPVGVGNDVHPDGHGRQTTVLLPTGTRHAISGESQGEEGR